MRAVKKNTWERGYSASMFTAGHVAYGIALLWSSSVGLRYRIHSAQTETERQLRSAHKYPSECAEQDREIPTSTHHNWGLDCIQFREPLKLIHSTASFKTNSIVVCHNLPILHNIQCWPTLFREQPLHTMQHYPKYPLHTLPIPQCYFTMWGLGPFFPSNIFSPTIKLKFLSDDYIDLKKLEFPISCMHADC